jgi:hypothetical protein
MTPVRCPGHTIQFPGYGYGKYIEKALELLSINRASLDRSKYGREYYCYFVV